MNTPASAPPPANQPATGHRLSATLTWIIVVAMVALSAFVRFYHLADGSDAHLTVLEDDFYYYALIAENIASNGVSTFDGVTHTNGYHPLWMGVLVLLSAVSNGLTPLFFILLAVVSGALALLFFRLLLAIGAELFDDDRASALAAMMVSVYCTRFFFSGMEVALTLPLAALAVLMLLRHGTLDAPTPRRAILFGFVLSLLVLSRLDAIVMVAVVLSLAWFLSPMSLQQKIRTLSSIALGMTPLALYLASNLLIFDTLTPISGQAKQLNNYFTFSTRMLEVLACFWDGKLVAALYPVALLVVVGKYRWWSPVARLVGLAVVIFPIAFFLLHGLLSGWVLYKWYLYPFALLFFIALGGSIEWVLGRLGERRRRVAYPLLVALLGAAIVYNSTRNTLASTVDYVDDPSWIYYHAKLLRTFTDAHPGRYGMGDRAGLTTFIIDKPVVQLEGLTADRRLLDHIAREDRLVPVLREYGIDYLIVQVLAPLPVAGGCYPIEIPHLQASDRSSRMRDTICQPPVYSFRSGDAYTYVFTTPGE